MVLWSKEKNKIILKELTVPWEEGCDQTFERVLNPRTSWLTAGGKGGRHGCSQSKSTMEDSLPSLCGGCSQPLDSGEGELDSSSQDGGGS